MDRKLEDYLPEFLREVKEIRSIIGAEQLEIEAAWIYAEGILPEFFLEDMTVFGMERWESLLEICPKVTDTLEERRFRIKTKLKKDLPYTRKNLEKKLSDICGTDGCFTEYDHLNYTILVKLALTEKSNFDEVELLLMRIIPANLIINLSLMYNQHLLFRPYIQGELEVFTHEQMREDVII